MKITSASLLPVAFLFAACSSAQTSDEGGGGASAGAAPSGGGASGGGAPGVAGARTGGAGASSTTAGASSTTAGASSTTAGASSTTAGASSTTAGAGGASGGTTGVSGGGGAGSTGRGGAGGSAGAMSAGGAGGAAPVGVSHLPVPAGAGGVAKPTGAATTLTTVHWAGFKGAVTYSFDDDNTSQIQNYDQLNALGVHYTFYMWTGKTDANNAVWTKALKDGHEIANHTQSHQSAGSVADINAATKFITDKFSTPPYTMAAPNGAQVYPGLAKGLFFINRMVSAGLIAPNDSTDPLSLPTTIPAAAAGASAYKSDVDTAASGGKWRTFCVHGFVGDSAAYQAVNLDGFIQNVTYAKTTGVWIDTMVSIGAYWQGEKAVHAAMSTTTGTSKTFTWTLPDKFPPGHYIRVTTDGGTLSQGGTPLAWDPHGYYEIALDAKSVTLSP